MHVGCSILGFMPRDAAEMYAAARLTGLALLLASTLSGGCRDEQPEAGRPFAPGELPTLADIGIEAEFGLREQDGPEAVLHKPLDAAFLGDGVAVLDASAPWLRVFDRQGRIVRGLVSEGEGPGEAVRPMSLSSTADGGVLLTHSRGIILLDNNGDLVRAIRRGFRARGVVEACGGALMALVEDFELPRSTAIVRIRPDGQVLDTVRVLTPVRPDGRNYHPWFVDPSRDRLLVYAENEDRDHLLELTCNGDLLREIQIDSSDRGR